MPLCISRTPGQSVVIEGGRIIVTISSVDRNKVKLHFHANPAVVIDRSEVHAEKQAEALKANKSRSK